MWFLPVLAIAFAANTGPATPGGLPAPIKSVLDQEYTGWKLAPVSQAVKEEFAKRKTNRQPSLAIADFNNDGKKDYAVQIALTAIGQEEQIIIVFLAKDDGYAESILQSMGLDPNTYLWADNKSLSKTGPDAQDKMVTGTVLRVLGGPAGDVAYAYEGERFSEVTMKDSLDTPNPEIPYVNPPPL